MDLTLNYWKFSMVFSYNEKDGKWIDLQHQLLLMSMLIVGTFFHYTSN